MAPLLPSPRTDMPTPRHADPRHDNPRCHNAVRTWVFMARVINLGVDNGRMTIGGTGYSFSPTLLALITK